ncbi:MAG: protein kinase [Candidatus Melainabacteria bacterium]|nr:protein kinase [Candidatus Melainabacteria bacterium]
MSRHSAKHLYKNGIKVAHWWARFQTNKMMSEQIPETFANRYKIIEKLGSGGMGVVYLAHDPVLNLNVAIKVLLADPTGLTAARLQREAMASGKLNHPIIARVFDFGQTKDGSPYMVMEYIDGKSLSELIAERGRLGVEEAIDIFRQILQGLALAHSHKIIHRNLKPSNIMVTSVDSRDQQVKLLDFGVAKLQAYSQELTSTGALLGSPIYMSPEQSQGDESDARSDIYSFGCLMFETLTGIPPFKGNSALETISMHKTKAPPLVTDVVSDLDISKELVSLIDSCLSKSPETRPQSCNDLLERLNAKPQKIQVEEIMPEAPKVESKTVMGQSPAVVAMCVAFLLALTAFAYMMINASIKIGVNKKEAEVIAKADVTQTTNTGLGGERGDELIFGMSSHRKEQKDGSTSMKFSMGIDDADLDRIDKKQKQIDFSNVNISHDQLEKLSELPLESLRLRGQELNDETVCHVSKIKTLKSLYCKNSLLTNKGIAQLGKLSNLEILRIGCPFVTSEGLSGLSQLKKLTSLQVDGDRLKDDTANYLTSFPALKSLGIGSANLSDAGVANLKKMPQLHILTIRSSLVTDQALSSLKDFKSLNIANFAGCRFSANCCVKLQPGKKMYGLSINGQRYLSVESAKALSKTDISILNLIDTPISDDALIEIGKMKCLSSLNLEPASLSARGLNALKSPPLKVLGFRHCLNLNDSMAKEISQLKDLTSLELARTGIRDNQLMMLASLSKLQNLNLDGCPGITAEGIEEFQKLYVSMHHKQCPIHRAVVFARDTQEAENFKNGMKDWRVKYEHEESD